MVSQPVALTSKIEMKWNVKKVTEVGIQRATVAMMRQATTVRVSPLKAWLDGMPTIRNVASQVRTKERTEEQKNGKIEECMNAWMNQ